MPRSERKIDSYRAAEPTEVFHELEKVDTNEHIQIEQKWRVVKIHELILAAKLHCGIFEGSLSALENLLNEYRSTNPEDLPVPFELVICLLEHRAEVKNIWGCDYLMHLAKKLRMIVNEIARSETLNEEIASLMS